MPRQKSRQSSKKNTTEQLYRLSMILKRRFTPVPFNENADIGRPVGLLVGERWDGEEPLGYHTNGRVNNYGRSVFPFLERLLPSVWTPKSDKPVLLNTNQGAVGWYIDGMEGFTVKANLTPAMSKYAIPAADPTVSPFDHEGQWILKPSHPHVGSGELIVISDNLSELLDESARPRTAVLSNGLRVELNPTTDWIVQPLIANPALWSGGQKFDCRFYAAIFRVPRPRGKYAFEGAVLRYGVGRVAVNPHDPLRDPLSAITNISVQERVRGYNSYVHLPLIYDDCGAVRDIVRDLIARADLVADTRKSVQIAILGLDVMFSGPLDGDGSGERSAARDRPRLIEVNHQPHLGVTQTDSEGVCSREYVRGVFGNIIPSLLQGVAMEDTPGWDWV